MKKSVYLLSVILLTACAAPRFHYEGATYLTQEEALADLDSLVGAMKGIHPDLYANRSEKQFGRDVKRIRNRFAKRDSVSSFDLYTETMELMAAFNEGHLSIVHNAYNRVSGNRYFPLPVEVDAATRALTLRKACEVEGVALQVGDEITHINGIRSQRYIQALCRQIAAEKRFVKYSKLSDGVLNVRMAWLNPTNDYTLRIRTTDGIRTIRTQGLDAMQLTRQMGQQRMQPYAYELLNDSTMLFHFNACQTKGFKAFAEELFSTARARDIRHLIIDIRNNGGGNSETGDEICRYISDRPFGWISHSTIRISEPVRQQRPTTLPDTLIHSSPISAEQLMQPYPDSLRFKGKCYLLMSHRTYSSAASFAWEFTRFGMGTAIGEEVGDVAISSGDIIYVKLPHSHLTAIIPYKIFYNYGIREGEPNRGAVPDIVVPKEEALERALQLIRTGE